MVQGVTGSARNLDAVGWFKRGLLYSKGEEEIMCSETKCGVTRSHLYECCPVCFRLLEDTPGDPLLGTATQLRGCAPTAPSSEVSPLLADRLQKCWSFFRCTDPEGHVKQGSEQPLKVVTVLLASEKPFWSSPWLATFLSWISLLFLTWRHAAAHDLTI